MSILDEEECKKFHNEHKTIIKLLEEIRNENKKNNKIVLQVHGYDE